MACARWFTQLAAPLLLVVACCACSSGGASRGPFTTTRPVPATPKTASESAASPSPTPVSGSVPRPEHVVVVIEENHSLAELTDPATAPFITSLARRSAVFTNSFAVTHPSQPNYLALFSGSTQAVTDDSCPQSFSRDNLARSLLGARLSFIGFSEGLPRSGYRGCSAGAYARKHNPWSDFTNVPASANRPLSAFPTSFDTLPTVSFVVPDETHDMHSASVSVGDRWLSDHLSAYLAWAMTHGSLLVITADEDDYTADNRILTLIAGAHVRAGRYGQRIDHYALLRTIEDMYGLSPLGRSAAATVITDVWAR